ncbi:MAG: hypothetical protein GWP91_10645 [Rhodobacterales bacterium]|nr:hypothetical protein [Rhodobacterales bacterium]
MWFSLLLLCLPALANGDTFVKPQRTAPVEQQAIDRYVSLFDSVLVRKLGRKTLQNPTDLQLEDPGDFLGGAAGEAAMDWSFWAVRRLPTPTLSLPRLQRQTTPKTPAQAVQAEPRDPNVEVTHRTSRSVSSKRRPASLNLGLSPRLPAAGSDQPIDATVLANGRGLGLSAWRLSSQPIARSWSVWMRRDLSRGLSLVASADSAPKQPELGGLSGGAILKVPGNSWRVYVHYDHAPSRKLTETEHKMALTLSMSHAKTRKP